MKTFPRPQPNQLVRRRQGHPCHHSRRRRRRHPCHSGAYQPPSVKGATVCSLRFMTRAARIRDKQRDCSLDSRLRAASGPPSPPIISGPTAATSSSAAAAASSSAGHSVTPISASITSSGPYSLEAADIAAASPPAAATSRSSGRPLHTLSALIISRICSSRSSMPSYMTT
ncbi:hypothetical protein Vafri_3171 [Volvox africanus]|uniref:Uncharacterized protein n=1 Tax=Volvox africanus TaxID=51714 RepID=A0A8J4AQY5_9CHLO|nr:hypothetical protein Vafri_3171 [Volvox africanus]